MASDNGDMETQEDALDAAIKTHRRAGTPDGLRDRCLSTVPQTNRVVVLTPVVPTDARLLTEKHLLSNLWFRWALAASLVIAASGFYFMWDYWQNGNLNMKRALARADESESMKSSAANSQDEADGQPVYGFSDDHASGYKMANGAVPELSEEARRSPVTDGRGRTEFQGLGPEFDSPRKEAGDKLPAEQPEGKVFAPNLKIPFRTGGFTNGRPESRDTNGSKEKRFTMTGGSGGGDAVGGESTKSGVKDGLANTATFKDQQNTHHEVNENYKQARSDAAKYAEPAKLSGDQARIRSEEAEVLREQLAQARQRKDEAQKIQFETQQKYIDLKASAEALAVAKSELEAREKELRNVVERFEENRLQRVGPNAEAYAGVVDNPFLPVSKCPLSTFSTDVDTASYANVRRFLNQGQMPPRDAVRIEELINYFAYDYAQPKAADPFSVNLEVAGCPWNGEHRLVRIGLKGREIADQQRPPANLVFLVDVSGSMQPANKLPLLKTAMKMLVGRLGENERVAIVTYSHEIRLVLPSTTCDSKETIIQALEGLQAAGSTNGGGGIQMAYSVAVENFIQGGTNRVILATDGDFNVGITDPGELTRFIEQKRESGVFLSVLGFGMGNLKDATLDRLADKGNGHYAYIDTIDEARKVLVDQLSGTLVTIAKDVKLQIEFNPRTVSAYRLIGYENRVMPAQDFNDDRKDAGEIGAGHTVTALYEIVPAGKSAGLPGTDPLKYQPQPEEKRVDEIDAKLEDGLRGDVRRELLTVKLRYKKPNEHQSLLAEVPLTDSGRRYGEASSDFKFASAVAAFGMILRNSPHRGSATLDGVLELGEDGRGADREGYRSEFLKLVRQVKTLRGQ